MVFILGKLARSFWFHECTSERTANCCVESQRLVNATPSISSVCVRRLTTSSNRHCRQRRLTQIGIATRIASVQHRSPMIGTLAVQTLTADLSTYRIPGPRRITAREEAGRLESSQARPRREQPLSHGTVDPITSSLQEKTISASTITLLYSRCPLSHVRRRQSSCDEPQFQLYVCREGYGRGIGRRINVCQLIPPKPPGMIMAETCPKVHNSWDSRDRGLLRRLSAMVSVVVAQHNIRSREVVRPRPRHVSASVGLHFTHAGSAYGAFSRTPLCTGVYRTIISAGFPSSDQEDC